jgi:polyphosphate kinase 2 (PPK2 family)
MGKTDNRSRSPHEDISPQKYKRELHTLQVELVKLQRHFITCEDKILVLLEGRQEKGSRARRKSSHRLSVRPGLRRERRDRAVTERSEESS